MGPVEIGATGRLALGPLAEAARKAQPVCKAQRHTPARGHSVRHPGRREAEVP